MIPLPLAVVVHDPFVVSHTKDNDDCSSQFESTKTDDFVSLCVCGEEEIIIALLLTEPS